MKRQRILLVIGAMLLATAALAHPTVTRELLQKFWADAQSATNKEISLTDEKKKMVSKALGSVLPKETTEADVYVVLGKAGSLGVLVNLDPPGMDVGVAIDRERKKIVKVQVYKQSGKYKFDDPAFLNQFAGKIASDAFKVGKDIKPVKGAEKESQTVATDIKAVLLIVQKGW